MKGTHTNFCTVTSASFHRHHERFPFAAGEILFSESEREREKKESERKRKRERKKVRERELNQQATETDKHGQVVAELLHSDYCFSSF